MGASAPLDSPTSIISSASSGITPLAESAPWSDSPSRTICVARPTVPCNSLLVMDSAAVCSALTSGVPPVSSVASVRQNWATWNFSNVPPSTGTRNFMRSKATPPSSLRDQKNTQQRQEHRRNQSQNVEAVVHCHGHQEFRGTRELHAQIAIQQRKLRDHA